MPRGCDNPNSRFNNRPSAMPWTWVPYRHFSNGEVQTWKSTRHELMISSDNGRFTITRNGNDLRGPKGRRRFFKTFGAAQVAADWEMGL